MPFSSLSNDANKSPISCSFNPKSNSWQIWLNCSKSSSCKLFSSNSLNLASIFIKLIRPFWANLFLIFKISSSMGSISSSFCSSFSFCFPFFSSFWISSFKFSSSFSYAFWFIFVFFRDSLLNMFPMKSL